MKKIQGLWTALVTPFKQGNGIDNEVDYEALERLLDMQIEAGVDGVLFLGTTAENPTLTQEEGKKIVEFGIQKLARKAKVMVNVGTYSTAHSLENIALFDAIDGIDAYLLVNPYYNKPTQTGLYKHFTTLAQATSRDVILYNIKGRTGVNLETQTLGEIVKVCPNVIGVKEASGDMEQMKAVIAQTPEYFSVLSGDDGLTYDLIQAGGDGVISVASDCIPARMKQFVDLCFLDASQAHKQNEEFSELFSQLFIQTNPLPAKTYLASKGLIEESFRLPMCQMDELPRKEFLEFVKRTGL